MGARLVRLYEAFSPAIANRVRTNRILAVTVRYVVVKPAAAFARLALGLMSMRGEPARRSVPVEPASMNAAAAATMPSSATEKTA